MRYLFFTIFACLALTAKGQVVSYFVDSSAAASGTGSSWSSPFRQLSDAVSLANAGPLTTRYEINVATGTYYPTGAQASTRRDSTFLITRGGIRILGGFPAGGGARNPAINHVVLSGAIGAGALLDNSRNIMIIGELDTVADSLVLDGLVFRDGYADSNLHQRFPYHRADQGAAIALPGNASRRMALRNCAFDANRAMGSGGAIACYGTMPLVANCVFTRNTTSQSGGAIAILAGANDWCIVGCVFSGNSTPVSGSINRGGAIFDASVTYLTKPLIDSCVFLSNTAGQGGGVYVSPFPNTLPSKLRTIRRCSFLSNFGAYGGGGMSYSGGSPCAIDSCTFTGNSSTGRGGGLSLATAIIADFSSVTASSFSQNAAVEGGGVYLKNLVGAGACSFTDNAARNGGGMYYEGYGADPGSIMNSRFGGNVASNYGGGIFVTRSSGSVAIGGSAFWGNWAGIGGGGLCDSAARPRLDYCTFGGDSAVIGNGIHHIGASPMVIRSSILWDGAGNSIVSPAATNVVQYSIVEGGHAGYANSAADPVFIRPFARRLAPTTLGNYRLSKCSPAIDTYSNVPGGHDADWNPRLYGSRTDLGAFEYQGTGAWPEPSGPDTVCELGSGQFAHRYPGGQWASSDSDIIVIDSSGKAYAKKAGTVTIAYSLDTGACPGRASKQLLIMNLPDAGLLQGRVVICRDSMAQWTSSVAGGSWFTLPPGKISIDSNGRATGLDTGTAVIGYRVRTPFGCENELRSLVHVVDCPATYVSGTRVEILRLSLVPNPVSSSGVVRITLPFAGSYELEVLDMSGRILSRAQGGGVAGTQEVRPYIGNLSSGVYFVRLRWNGQESVQRWIRF